MHPILAHLLVLSEIQDVKFEILVKSRVDKVKEAMTYSMKLENKLDGASLCGWEIPLTDLGLKGSNHACR